VQILQDLLRERIDPDLIEEQTLYKIVLLQFKYPIVLWLTNSMATALAKQAPDFWSWRAGVFEFQATEDDYEDLGASVLITEYKQITKQLEEQNPRSALLISFYDKIAEDYQVKGQLENSLKYYQLAQKLSKENKDSQGQIFYQKKIDQVLENVDQVNELKKSDKISFSGLPLAESSRPWYRFVGSNYPSSLFFDKSLGRFGNDSYPVLYVASDIHVMFAEIFRSGSKIVFEKSILAKEIFEIKANKPLLFADFTGHGLSLIGQDIMSLYGNNYTLSRELAKIVGNDLSNVDEIKYRSCYDLNRFCYAVFDRAARYLNEKKSDNLFNDHPELLANILNTYKYGLCS
jgi:RES domain